MKKFIHIDEEDVEGLFLTSSEKSGDVFTFDDDWVKPKEKKRKDVEYISLDYKTKIISLAKTNPTWTLQTLQKKGGSRLKRKDHLKRWGEDVKKDGTNADKLHIIDTWTYDRFVEARQNNNQVTTRYLQQWALAAVNQFQSNSFSFRASKRWVTTFKKRHKIRQRKIIKYVNEKECISLEETGSGRKISENDARTDSKF